MFEIFVLLAPYVCFHILVKVIEWPPIGKIAAHSAYEMFSWYQYLIVGLVFSHLGFWSGNLFLIAPFPDLCLLVPLFHLICVKPYLTGIWYFYSFHLINKYVLEWYKVKSN